MSLDHRGRVRLSQQEGSETWRGRSRQPSLSGDGQAYALSPPASGGTGGAVHAPPGPRDCFGQHKHCPERK